MQQQLAKTDDEYKPSVWEFWRGYNNKKVIHNTEGKWYEVIEARTNSMWQMYDQRAYMMSRNLPIFPESRCRLCNCQRTLAPMKSIKVMLQKCCNHMVMN
jgi:hypothetical protein